MTDRERTRSLTAPDGLEPQRLDLFLAERIAGCSRRRAQLAIASNGVRINGRRARKGQQVAAGDVVQVPESLWAPYALAPNPTLRLVILYEDDAVIVVEKPPGMASHALRSEQTATVANFLLGRYPELAAVGKTPFEAGAVHRLDTDTSGVLMIARTPNAYNALRQQFARHQVLKEYLSIVHGDVREPGEVRTPIAHHRNQRMMRVAASSERARPALTSYRPLDRTGTHTLLQITIRTGVMHQIRVHLASIGHPVVGDRVYGKQDDTVPRQLLHAHRLAVRHPQTGVTLSISSPIPADFRAFGRKRQRDRKPKGRSDAT